MSNPRDSSLWRNRDYILLWGGQVVSTFGSMASYVIFPLLILALTDSPKAAGIAGALRWIPYVLFSLPVGALVDRWDRKRVMILCDAGRAVAVGSIPVALAFDALTLAQIYIVTFVEGSLFVFFNLAEVAALPRVVPRAQLPEATAQNEAGFGAANIVGPSFGTFLYQSFGRAVPFVADAITYVVSMVSLMGIKATFQGEPSPRQRPHLGEEIVEGLRWLWSKPLIRFMALLTGGSNLVFAAMPLVMIVLAKELGASDAQIGLIFSISGVGGIVGSLVGGRIQRRFSFGQVVIACMWLWLATIAGLLLAPSWIAVGILGALNSFFGPIYNVVQFSYRVALIPDALQGRVNSTFRMLAFGFIPIGAALAGWLIEGFGIAAAIVVLSAVQLAMSVAASVNPHIRHAAPITSA